ncbi:hypothetical protein CGH53_24395 [Vibrio parahaemolyticus]|nr:hypothetical protein CGH53_24395 [Vibrio parahaemolyticus]
MVTIGLFFRRLLIAFFAIAFSILQPVFFRVLRNLRGIISYQDNFSNLQNDDRVTSNAFWESFVFAPFLRYGIERL